MISFRQFISESYYVRGDQKLRRAAMKLLGKSSVEVDAVVTFMWDTWFHSGGKIELPELVRLAKVKFGLNEGKSSRPSTEEWNKIWEKEVPHWSPTTQGKWQKMSKSGSTADGMQAWIRAFASYFKDKWDTVVPATILNKVYAGDGNVTLHGEKYSIFSEKRELMYELIFGENTGKKAAKSLSTSTQRRIAKDLG